MATSVLASAAVGAGAGPASGDTGAFAGVCRFTIQVTFTPDLEPATTEPTSLLLDGDGTCTMEDGIDYPAELDGTLGFPLPAPNYLCAGGVAQGNVRVTVDDHPTFSSVTFDGAVVGTAATATMALANTDTQVLAAGAGTFVQDAADAVTCATGDLQQTTWCGVLAFGDPPGPLVS